jgi:DNA-binding NarL/FixJ family response regulator
MQFLAMRGQGKLNKQIARECNVSEKTVEWTLRDACQRLGTTRTICAVVLAVAYEILILTADGDVLVPEAYNHLAA